MSKADPDSGQGTAIAVVGMAVRVPGAATADEFWRNLRAGLESVTVFGESELVEAGVSLEVVRRPDYVRAKPVLDAIDGFDADFFRLSPREAACIRAVAQGLSNPAIARQRGVSPHTIRNQLSSALRKLGLQNRYEITAAVLRAGESF